MLSSEDELLVCVRVAGGHNSACNNSAKCAAQTKACTGTASSDEPTLLFSPLLCEEEEADGCDKVGCLLNVDDTLAAVDEEL